MQIFENLVATKSDSPRTWCVRSKKQGNCAPHIALLGIGMPEADGYHVAARLRELPEMPADDSYVARIMESGLLNHLVKPVDPSMLETVLQETLAKFAE